VPFEMRSVPPVTGTEPLGAAPVHGGGGVGIEGVVPVGAGIVGVVPVGAGIVGAVVVVDGTGFGLGSPFEPVLSFAVEELDEPFGLPDVDLPLTG
jgi:hypothetical protein